MSRFRHERLECKVYVGDLSTSASKQDVEDAFSYYGNIRNVWVARNPPGFAFVEYEDVRDAEDAVREIDGRRTICGRKVRVERAGDRRMNFQRGGGYRPYRGSGGYRGRGNNNGRPFHPDDRCYQCGRKGHYARDCEGPRGGGRHGRSYSRSNSRDRSSRSRSRGYRSRSRDRDRHSKSHRSRSDDRRSKSNDKKSRDSRSRSPDDRKSSRAKSGSYDNRKNRSRSSSKSRSRSRSEVRKNGDSSSNHKD